MNPRRNFVAGVGTVSTFARAHHHFFVGAQYEPLFGIAPMFTAAHRGGEATLVVCTPPSVASRLADGKI
jgi:hypothetical protein